MKTRGEVILNFVRINFRNFVEPESNSCLSSCRYILPFVVVEHVLELDQSTVDRIAQNIITLQLVLDLAI